MLQLLQRVDIVSTKVLEKRRDHFVEKIVYSMPFTEPASSHKPEEYILTAVIVYLNHNFLFFWKSRKLLGLFFHHLCPIQDFFKIQPCWHIPRVMPTWEDVSRTSVLIGRYALYSWSCDNINFGLFSLLVPVRVCVNRIFFTSSCFCFHTSLWELRPAWCRSNTVQKEVNWKSDTVQLSNTKRSQLRLI